MLLYWKMLERQQENEDERSKFEDKEEASEFWRALCETESGNAGMEWVEGVREAMREVVPEIPTTGFKLKGDKVRQAIRKKKNWNASGPVLLANSW